MDNLILTPVPLDALLQALRQIVKEELVNQQLNELQEKYLSPEETCKLFTPAITKPTLESYVEKKHFKKYYLEGRTWFKYGEVIAALKSIKRYSRNELLTPNPSFQ
jgi:hypothetical protein